MLAVAFAAGGRNTVDLLGDKASLTLDLAETRLTGHLDPATRQLAFLADLIAARMVDGGGSGATLPPEAVEAAAAGGDDPDPRLDAADLRHQLVAGRPNP